MAIVDDQITATSQLTATGGAGGPVFADFLPLAGKAYIMGRLGLGAINPQNTLDVEGGGAVGAGYAGAALAPANGLIVEGNVGIGTNAPGAKLDVAGTLQVSQEARLMGRVGIGVAAPQNALDVEGAIAVGAAYSGSAAAPVNGMIVQGNVGLGTPTPATRLHVAGTSPSLRIADGTQGDGRLLTSDASGNATWKDNSRYSISVNLNNAAITATATWQKMGDYLTFTKSAAASSVEVHCNTRAGAGGFSHALGVRFQLRIDDAASSISNDAAITISNAVEFISMFAVFQGLAAGAHTVSIWTRTNSGTSANVVLDPSGFGGRIIAKETF